MIRALILVAACALLSACGPDQACGGSFSPSSEAAAPHIESMRLAGQLEQDPWTMVLSLEFEDDDGNLGLGTASFYLNHSDEASTRQQMRDAFRQNALLPT